MQGFKSRCPRSSLNPKFAFKWNVKFLWALHSLKHNDEAHLETRAFLCTHFSLHYSQSAVLGEPQVLETLLTSGRRSPALIQAARWRGLTQRGLVYWDGGKFERPSQFSVGGWVRRLKFKRSFNFEPGDWVYLRGVVYLIYVKEWMTLWLVSCTVGKTGADIEQNNKRWDL